MKLSHKAKQFFLFFIKILVVGLAFYFIKTQLKSKEFDVNILTTALHQSNAWLFVTIIFLLAFCNRFIEILKWKNLAQTVRKISVWESTKQVLIAITLGIFTPNGIGEYAGKALFYPRKNAGKIVFLNAVCNGVQVIYAITFGLIGTFIIHSIHPFLPDYAFLYLLGIISGIIVLLFSIKNIRIKGYSLQTLIDSLRKIPKIIHQKNLILALCRYLVLVHQYYFLYWFFGVAIPYHILLSVVASVYLLASSLPNFQAVDFALKGSIALFLFGFFGVNEWVITIVATSIWILNLVLPISIGSILVLLFRPKRLQKSNN